MKKYIILVPNNKRVSFYKYMNSEDVQVENVYSNLEPNKVMRYIRKGLYFSGFQLNYLFYGDWVKQIKDKNVQLIVFDSSRPYCRLKRVMKQAANRPIVYFWNPVDISNKKMEKLKRDFGVFTYSSVDAKTFEIGYNPQFFPQIDIDTNKDIKYDGLFLGKNKDRLVYFEKIYSWFNSPFFYVVKDRDEHSDLIDLKDTLMSYDKYLEMVMQSSVLIEILATENAGLTLRTVESIFFQKRLITNNSRIKDEVFYNENNILVIDENTTKDDYLKFISKDFKPYSEKIIGEYKFEMWLKRFTK